MNKIAQAFANGKAFIPFITCGDPDLETTAACVRAAVAAGADMIELGIPFSNPTAEGPVVQGANLRALGAGVTTDDVFELVRGLRGDVHVPIAVMTYANVAFSYGAQRFIAMCAEVGIDALILHDLPHEERDEFAPLCAQYGVALVPLVAPTSAGRVAMIAREAEGFACIVSGIGESGASDGLIAGLQAIAGVIGENTRVPCAVSVDSCTPELCAKVAAIAGGVIVGSAVVSIIAEHGRQAPAHVESYVRAMKGAVAAQLYQKN